jgi:hypothetical protein
MYGNPHQEQVFPPKTPHKISISNNVSTSTQSLFERSNLESISYDDDDFRNGSHDNHLCSIDDLIAFVSQKFDNCEDLRLILVK